MQIFRKYLRICFSYNDSITARALEVREWVAEETLSVSLPPPNNTMTLARIPLHKM
jgi:hypothetical protein